MMDLPNATRQHAMSAMTAVKDRAEKSTAAAITNINHTALLEMYMAGYSRCMVDHNIEGAPAEGTTNGS
jgi:hypothetical protein